jgi:hypothetical protein
MGDIERSETNRSRDRWCSTCRRLTNHVAAEHPPPPKRESEEDRLRTQLAGAVEALREIADRGGPYVAGQDAYEMAKTARDWLTANAGGR